MVSRVIKKAWWVVVCWIGCLAFFEYGAYLRSQDSEMLIKSIQELEHEYASLIKEQTQLKLQLQANSDPEWQTLTLIRVLGVVPDGWVKIYFDDE